MGAPVQVMAFRAAGGLGGDGRRDGGGRWGDGLWPDGGRDRQPFRRPPGGRGAPPPAVTLAAAAATGSGRAVRLLLASLLVPTGLVTVQGAAGAALALLGVSAILEVLFDVWLPGWLAGAPLDGRAARRAARGQRTPAAGRVATGPRY